MDSRGFDAGSQGSRSGEECGAGSGGTGWGDGGASKKRQRRFTASERARHRVIEKERREAFGACLLELAGLIPALHDTKQSLLSKHVIVQESIKQHRSQQEATRLAERKLLAVTAERDALLLQMRILGLADRSTGRCRKGPHGALEEEEELVSHQSSAVGMMLDPRGPTAYAHMSPGPEPLLHQLPQVLPLDDIPPGIIAAADDPMSGLDGYQENVELDVYFRQAIAECMPYYVPPA